MNRNALVIHGNKCTSSIFIFMLRFSVDFLWIGVSEWTVRFSLCVEQKCIQASASHLGTTPTLWFTWNDLESISVRSFFPLCTAEIFSDVFLYSNHRSKILCQTLMKKPKRLRLDSLVLSKEGRPVPQSCGQAWLSSGKGCPHHPAQGADAHSTQAEEGWLPHPQKSEPHLDSCPKIHELHHRAESRPVKIHIALTGYRVDCYLIHWWVSFHFKRSIEFYYSCFFVLFHWNVSIIVRLICSPLKRKP